MYQFNRNKLNQTGVTKMKNSLRNTTLLLALAFSASAFATTPTGIPPCPTGTTTCESHYQNMGDTSVTNSADNTKTTSTQAGVSSASNQSGVANTNKSDISSQNSSVTKGELSNVGGNTDGTITGGNTSSDAKGNISNNDNKSSATTGQSNSGGNTMTGGANTANGGTSNSSQGQSSSNTVGQSSSNTLANGSNSGGNTTGSSADNSGGNSSVNVDASDRSSTSYSSRTTFIPAVVPSSPAAALGVGQVTAIVGTCGSLQRVIKTPIEGTYVGIVKKSKIQQGFDYELAPFFDAQGVQRDYREVPLSNGAIKLMGHQPIYFTTIVGVAAARNVALGGGGSSGDWGQAGMGSSSSMQQLVSKIQLRDCEVGTLEPVRYIEVPVKKISQ